MKLTNMSIHDTHMVITLPYTKTGIVRTFTINQPLSDYVRAYINLRPENIDHDYLFINFRDGKCTRQRIGINKIGAVPQKVADWLGLDNSYLYTGHSFRRTSATLLANAGASITELKRHGGWKSPAVAEGYVADSIGNKRKICDKITSSFIDAIPGCSSNNHVTKRSRVSNQNCNVVMSPDSHDDLNRSMRSINISSNGNADSGQYARPPFNIQISFM
ncbi:hypothetical protein QAD02_000623 [Eretmocerus hayati]|uniref:Uncharacterized protein n=1 Tax=Eretmocerus hayati TaxID=131215 RepID=A0ACC2NG86_9HYME|nr:hypothetical protein QAD02_000623 [Eretmocerus hayati]